jgi:CRP/FNR family cyclic AMP-dependent transcriptional regulator
LPLEPRGRPGYAAWVKTVRVLQVDPDLGAELMAPRREAAERLCIAPVVELPRGSWDGEAGGEPSGFGLLVLAGTLCRRVVQNEHRGVELLAAGDLLRPWDRIGEWSSVPTESGWLVVEHARLALLGADFARRCAPFPEVAVALVRRSVLRSRYLAVLMAIAGERKVSTRLELLFWHLADRFGQMRGEWIQIPVPLTHSILAELVAARRPSVSTALSALSESELLVRDDGGGWLLRGPLPGKFEASHRASA